MDKADFFKYVKSLSLEKQIMLIDVLFEVFEEELVTEPN